MAFRLPLTRNREKDTLAFSFAGLLSAMERKLKTLSPRYKHDPPPLELQRAMSRAFQAALVGHVVDKTRKVIDTLGYPVHGLVVSGGVGSNKYLRAQ